MADFFGDPAAASSGFADLLDDPRARAALLQFGINMMQPQYGQSTLGAIGGAIGAGGEAIGRIEEQDRKAAETVSKIGKREADLSTAQGKLDATAQSNTIRQQRADSEQAAREGRINLGQQQLEFGKSRAAESERRFGLTQAFKERDSAERSANKVNEGQNKLLRSEAEYFMSAVDAERKRVDTANQFLPSTAPRTPFNPALEPYKDARTPVEIEEKMRNDPVYMERFLSKYGQRAPQGGGTMQVPNTPRPISGTMEDSGGVSYPVAPPSPTARSVGQVYQTPRGPLEWTGQGWRTPSL